MELSFSGSVPIYSYRRPRSNSASSKKTPFFKTKKKNNAIKVSTTRKDGNRSSTSSDAPATVTVNNNVGSRPSTSDHENQAAAAAAARQGQGPSPTGSSASLPPPDEPPPPLSARFVRDSPSLATSTRHPPGQPPLRSASNSNEAVNSANLPLSDLAARSAHAKTARPIEGAVAMGAANELSKVHSHSTQKSIDVSETIVNFGMGPQSGGNTFAVPPGPNQFNPVATYHHVQDMAAKRVSTLDYLRKT